MKKLKDITLKSNPYTKFNFDGGDLTSDAGLLLVNEFMHQIGFVDIVEKIFKTSSAAKRLHTDSSLLLQKVFQVFARYFEDNCADELAKDPVFTNILNKDRLASQPTLSRFSNRLDNTTLKQLKRINEEMLDKIYSINPPEQMLFDIDTTLFNAYGQQEGAGFNNHYQAKGFHPILCFENLTGDLIDAELREGTKYCSKDAETFIEPILKRYSEKYPSVPLYLRADSGFAAPEIYKVCEKYHCKYVIRLKENNRLHALAADGLERLERQTKDDKVSYCSVIGEFNYRADSWSHPRRVVYKIEKLENEMLPTKYTFIVTTMECLPEQVLMLYCQRGSMENFIKEGKEAFDFSSVSSKSMIVNQNRLLINGLAFNLFNWLRRLALPIEMRKFRADTIRIKLIKIAARIVHSAKYLVFKLCSSCPYKKEFYETLQNIWLLKPKLS